MVLEGDMNKIYRINSELAHCEGELRGMGQGIQEWGEEVNHKNIAKALVSVADKLNNIQKELSPDPKEAIIIKAAMTSTIEQLKMYEKASQVQILKWLLENATTGDWRRVVSLKIGELRKGNE